MSTSDAPPAQLILRIAGAITLVASLIQFGIDIAVYQSLTAPKLGAWWSAIVTIVASVLGVISINRGLVIAAMVFGIIAIIVGIVGCAVDGIASRIITDLVTCIDTDGEVFGSSVYSSEAQYCRYWNTNDCLCVQASTASSCFGYDGPLAQDSCDNILTVYTRNITAAIAFDLIASICVFALTIITCVSVCCPGSMAGGATEVHQPPAPGGVQLAVAQPQAYGQVPQYAGQPQAQPQVVVVVANGSDQSYKPQY